MRRVADIDVIHCTCCAHGVFRFLEAIAPARMRTTRGGLRHEPQELASPIAQQHEMARIRARDTLAGTPSIGSRHAIVIRARRLI
jgi:hypothetical protein